MLAATLRISRHDIAYFAHAVGLRDPVHFDPDAACRAGYPDVLAPRSFYLCLGTLAETQPPLAQVTQDGLSVTTLPPLPPTSALGGGATVRFLGPMYAGDTVTVRMVLTDMQEKRSSTGSTLIVLSYLRSFAVAHRGVAVEERQTRLRRARPGST